MIKDKAMNLQEFLNANKDVNDKQLDIILGDRFGEMPFTIQVVSEDVMGAIAKKTRKFKEDGLEIDFSAANVEILIQGCVMPNMRDKASHDAVGVHSSQAYVKKILLPGEIQALAGEIQKLSGFVDFKKLQADAKNSLPTMTD